MTFAQRFLLFGHGTRNSVPFSNAAIASSRATQSRIFGYRSKRGKGGPFPSELLRATGLIRVNEGSIYEWVTSELHNLFWNAYFAKRRKDRVPIFSDPQSGVYEVCVNYAGVPQ